MAIHQRLIDILNLTSKLTKKPHQRVFTTGYTFYTKPPSLLDDLAKAMFTINDYHVFYYRQRSCHPTVALFIECFFQLKHIKLCNSYTDAHVTAQIADDFNAAIEKFIATVQSDWHQKRIANAIERNYRRNTASLRHHIDSLFNIHTKLLFVRIDTHYTKQTSQFIDIEEAKNDREVFLREVKKRFNHLISYFWKVEYGVERGFHHHIMFIFNGSKLQNDISLGKQLGDLWVSLGKNQRTYYNCNADRQKYLDWGTYGIGAIHYMDIEKRNNLIDYVVNYQLKPDENLLAVIGMLHRSIGKMGLPKPSGYGGRPRRY